MKQILLFSICLVSVHLLFPTRLEVTSGDIRGPNYSTEYDELLSNSEKLTVPEINNRITKLKLMIQKFDRQVKDLKNELEGASSIKGMTKEEIDGRENKILFLNKMIKQYQEQVGKLKIQLDLAKDKED